MILKISLCSSLYQFKHQALYLVSEMNTPTGWCLYVGLQLFGFTPWPGPLCVPRGDGVLMIKKEIRGQGRGKIGAKGSVALLIRSVGGKKEVCWFPIWMWTMRLSNVVMQREFVDILELEIESIYFRLVLRSSVLWGHTKSVWRWGNQYWESESILWGTRNSVGWRKKVLGSEGLTARFHWKRFKGFIHKAPC